MEKRLIIAIALSLLVLMTWSALAPKPQPIENKEVVVSNTSPKTPVQGAAQSSVPAMPAQKPSSAAATISFAHGEKDIIFDPLQAAITEVTFHNSIDHRLPLKAGLLSNPGLLFKLKSRSKDSLTFVHEDGNKSIIKRFIMPNNSNTIGLEIVTKNLSTSPLVLNQQLVLGYLDLSSKQARFQDVLIGGKEKTSHVSAGKNCDGSDVKFVGLRDQYFCAILEPLDTTENVYVRKIDSRESEVGLLGSQLILQSGAQIGHSYRMYLGPQDLKTISSINPEWTSIIYFGTFDFIAQLLLQLLTFFYSLVHNWGVAIIILSIAVYIILFPLSIKQMRSMKEMQVLQPKIEALRKEFKDNPQRLNKEIMELYREHKVNPLSGCLPLLLQMPIFFALYQALIRSVSLRGAHFLWIKDLSSPDKLFEFKNSIPFLGNQFNLLPILMAIGMFVQQKISTGKATTGEAAQQQKIMSIVMPIMFGVIFYQMPSGLVLYWFVNSILMLIFQARINSQK